MSAILIQHFHYQVMSTYVEELNKKLCENSFFCNKTKTKAPFENSENNFLDIEKNFTKTKFQTNLIWFRIPVAPRNLEGITKLDTILEQFVWQILDFYKIVNWQYLEYELWGNN